MFANCTIRGVKVPSVAFYAAAVILIVAYGCYIRARGVRDPLAVPLYSHPILQEVDGWSVSHLLFFALLGYLYPGHHLQFLIVGGLWEVVESALGQNRLEVSGKRVQLIGDQAEDGSPTGKKDAYWYGKESDIVMDALGYALGDRLSRAVRKRAA